MKTMYEYTFVTGNVTIDHSICPKCESKACVKACSLYGRNVLRLEKGLPVVSVATKDVGRLCIECLACELNCHFYGKKALKVHLPFPELDEYRKKIRWEECWK